jgi:hypothetical protein
MMAGLITSVILAVTERFHQLRVPFVFQVNLCEGIGSAGLPVEHESNLAFPLIMQLETPILRHRVTQLRGMYVMCSHYQLSLALHQGGKYSPCLKDRCFPDGYLFGLQLFSQPRPIIGFSCFVSGLFL